MSVLSSIWAKPIPIHGTSDWGQFPLFLNKNTQLSTWSEDYLRQMPFTYVEHTSHKGISSLRYALLFDLADSPVVYARFYIHSVQVYDFFICLGCKCHILSNNPRVCQHDFQTAFSRVLFQSPLLRGGQRQFLAIKDIRDEKLFKCRYYSC